MLVAFLLLMISLLIKSLRIIEGLIANVADANPYLIKLTLYVTIVASVSCIGFYGLKITVAIQYFEKSLDREHFTLYWAILVLAIGTLMTIYMLIILYTLSLLVKNDPNPQGRPKSKARQSYRPSTLKVARTKKSETNDMLASMMTIQADEEINQDHETRKILETSMADDLDDDLEASLIEDEEGLTDEERLLQRTVLQNLCCGGFQMNKSTQNIKEKDFD